MQTDRLVFSLFLFLAVGAGCREAGTPASLDDATYIGIQDHPITLTDGEWRGEPFTEDGASRPSVGRVRDFEIGGDLDGDGVAETVVLLWSSSGGSGTYDYLAAMGRDSDGAPVNLATTALGDRVRIRSAEVVRHRLIVEVVEAGPEDAACCPGQKVRRTFVLREAALQEVSTEDLGRLSIADLAGVEWRLERFDRTEPLPVDIEITLIFDGYGIAGTSACNRYNGSVIAENTPGALRVDGPIATTRMACPPPDGDIEKRYLAALQGITRYSFVAGRLALSWGNDDESGTLIFAPRASIEAGPVDPGPLDESQEPDATS